MGLTKVAARFQFLEGTGLSHSALISHLKLFPTWVPPQAVHDMVACFFEARGREVARLLAKWSLINIT